MAFIGQGKIESNSIGQISATSTINSVSYAQNVWLSALQWCESRGKETAINKKDRDGTPSYYSFQFKPQTFKSFGEIYGIISKGLSDKEIMVLLKDTSLQRQIVSDMILDPTTNWSQQFPVCTVKLGLPPKY